MMRTLALLLIATLAGCAAQAAGQNASVDVNALVRAHPLYGTLAQYDRQIAALQATLHVPEFARKSEAFDNAASATRSTLNASASRTRAIAAMPTPGVGALKATTNVNAPSESRVRSDIQRAYSNQASQVRASARQDMDRYRSQLLAQQTTAFDNYVRAINARVQQAYNSRRQELYEKESALQLDLTRADAAKVLSIRTKLRTLALSADRRHALLAQLDAISNRQDAIVARQRKRDEATLASFAAPLQARAQADIAHMRAELQQRTAANLAARERVLAAQTAQRGALDLGANAQAGSAHTDMNAQLDALQRAKPGDAAAFENARDDLAKQFAAVHGADDAATRSTLAQIQTLRTQRAQLYTDIVTQIMNDARAVARARGLGRVYVRNAAPAGSTDITRIVRSDFVAMER
jgi:hypothetical protein